MINVVTVIPISRGISKDMLTYFSAEDLKPGAIVDVPIRNTSVPALVVDITPASLAKQEVKSQSWNLKKIETKRHDRFFTEAFMKAVGSAADYFATTKGSVLSALIPRSILQQKNLPVLKDKEHPSPKKREEFFVLQSDLDDRYSNHKSLIREEFARGSSVFFLFPTIEDIRSMAETLQKGIERYTYIVHGDLSAKELAKVWENALAEKHPVLILGTGMFLSLPRPDIGTYVVERESSRSYKVPSRPHLDFRTFVEFLAEHSGCRLIYADTLLRTETIWRYKEGDLVEIAPLKFRVPGTADAAIVDMRKQREEGAEPAFELFSNELKELFDETLRRRDRLLLLSARRGFFPTTSCGDCGTIVLCENCSAPVVLHGALESKSNFFLCHKCGERRSPDTHCAHCGSWKLITLGIGSEGVERAVKSSFPALKVFRLDADSAPTAKKARGIQEQFLQSQGGVLIGTEMALSFLHGVQVPSVAVVSVDALLSIPDFRVNERILQVLLKARRIATQKFLVQSRSPQTTVLKYALQGNLIDFYREEINERKNFGYPPFSVLIKISLSGEKEKVRKEVQKLGKILERYNAASFPELSPEKRGSYTMHTVIKLDREQWVDSVLLEILRSLPPQYDVAVDPESLL